LYTAIEYECKRLQVQFLMEFVFHSPHVQIMQ
jgi:hypothetical protein